jgi:hypothetical protein
LFSDINQLTNLQMPNQVIQNSVLLKTSSANDVRCSGGVLTITGIGDTIRKSDITSIYQNKYYAEVAQVVTVGSSSYTPAASTTYSVVIFDPLRSQNGGQEVQTIYSYTTPATITDIGASAALQREYIHDDLVAKINANTRNHVVAASLNSGNGFTVTDDGGYWPVFSQSMTNVKGISTVYTITDPTNAGGFQDDYSVTTTGVYSFGVGAKLAQANPVVDFVYGNLVSGVLTAPPLATDGTTATSGQFYDGFVISSLKPVSAHNVTGQIAYQDRLTVVYVDNGAGAATTNLAGFKAFERAMLNHIFNLYEDDPSTIYMMGDFNVNCAGAVTGLPSGATLAENVVNFGNGHSAHYSPILGATGVALISTATGMALNTDAGAGEGVEVSAPTWTNSQQQFVVGQQPAAVYAKVNIDDVTGLDPFWVGFRKKAAYGASMYSYSDFGVVGLGNATGDIYTGAQINATGATYADSGLNWADNETHTLEALVDIDGVVTFKVDGYALGTQVSLTFDANDVIIPIFGHALQASDIGTVWELELASFADDGWRI